MAIAYYYSSSAQQMSLVAPVTGPATTIIVNTVAGLPGTTPFKLVIDPGLVSEEIVKVTNVSGTTLTVVRGWDGSSSQTHANLAEVRHMVTAEDLRLSREHENATAAHGRTGALVGTTDAQALTNKDLSSGTNTFPASLATDNEVSAAITAHAGSTGTHGVTGEIVGTAGVQTLTNKNLGSATNTFPSTLATVAQLNAEAATRAAADTAEAALRTTLAATVAAADTALDARLDTLEADTGTLSSGFTVAAGWTLNQQIVRKVGKVVQVYLRLTRSGANIAGNSTGDIVNVSLGDMAAGYIPSMPTSGGGGNATGITFGCGIWTDGGVFLSATPPNVTINTGESISMSFTYLI